MEKTAIEHRVEARPETGQVEGVEDLETNLERTLRRLLPCPCDGGGGGIETGRRQPGGRGHERVFTRPAAHVEDAAPDLAGVGQAREGGLRPADVPRRWRLPLVGGVELLDPRYPPESRVDLPVATGLTVVSHGPLYHRHH
jgi:hypothetical protein